MNHMIPPVAEPIPVADYISRLDQQYMAWANAGRDAVRSAGGLASLDSWGAEMKRITVTNGALEQPLVEVINQCATVERLLDALAWSEQQAPSGLVLRCHPTASSAKPTDSVPDHDLVVQATSGQLRFEVSDVVNSKHDGNRKEKKDLESLWFVNGAPAPSDSHRRFLVVSPQFAELMRRKQLKRKDSRWCYTFHAAGETRIVEVEARDGEALVIEASSP